jgi:DNA polymerase-3 subunit delta
MTRLLTGENTFAIVHRLDELKSNFVSKNPSGEITQVDASDLDAAELNGLLTNASLFSRKSLVIIKNVDDNKELAERLPDILDRLPDDTDLILVSSKPDKRTRWYKSAAKQARVETYGELSDNELARWAVARAQELGSELTTADARILVSRVGLNQTRIDSELQKLAIYDKNISKASIEFLVDKTLEESVFDLIDAVVKGRTKRAHKMYDELLLTDIDAYKFIGLISWQLHNLLVIKTNENMPDGNLASRAGMAPFVVSKTRRLSANLSLGQIKQMIGHVLKADSDIKQTRADSDSRIKLLIDQISLLAADRI